MKEKVFIAIFFLGVSSSSAQITDHNKSIPKDFNLQNNQLIDIYCGSNIVEISEDGKLPQNTRQQYIVDKVVELFRLYIPTVKPEYGKNKLPSIYKGKISLNAKEERKKFLNKTKADFIFIVYNVISSDQPGITVSSPGSYWTPPQSNNKNKMSFEFWDAQKKMIIFDFEIAESGNSSIDDVLFKAVDFIKKREKANRQ